MTPDVNVLLAASGWDHPHHRTALDWLEEALLTASRGERLLLLPMVAAGFPQLATYSRVFVEPTPLEAAIDFLTALRGADGVELVRFGDEWPLLEPLCRQHQLMGHAISDGWIAAAVLAHHDCRVTFDRDFVPLLAPRRLVLLES